LSDAPKEGFCRAVSEAITGFGGMFTDDKDAGWTRVRRGAGIGGCKRKA
jgi:hypothetical protein